MNHKRRLHSSINWVRRLNLLVVLALLLALVGPVAAMPVSVQAKKDEVLRADPRLLQLAAEHPDDVFPVIIQRDVKNKDLPDDDPEAAVGKGGGRVKKQLKMIESLSAELTGKKIEKLARHKKIRWISLDAPLFSTALPGFGTTGIVTTAIGSGNEAANAMVLQPDGKTVVAGGSVTGSYNDFALVRYNSNGSLDTSFGAGGIVTTAVSSNHDYAQAVDSPVGR